MSKVFLKKENESWELVDKKTGEVTKFIETFVVDDQHWLKLYVHLYSLVSSNLTGGAKDVFSLCLKHAKEDKGDGNYFYSNDKYFVEDLKNINLLNNKRKYLSELVSNGLIYRQKEKCLYTINPQIAYCGDKHNRAKLILKITN